MNDANDDVRQAAAELAGALRGSKLRPFNEPLLALIESEAFLHAVPQLLITLERAPDRVDNLVLKCSRRFIDMHAARMGDIRTGAAGDARQIGELLLRAYAQAMSRNARRELSEILDLLDQLLALGAYGIADLVGESERA